jgi:hypothetical protein
MAKTATMHSAKTATTAMPVGPISLIVFIKPVNAFKKSTMPHPLSSNDWLMLGRSPFNVNKHASVFIASLCVFLLNSALSELRVLANLFPR